MLARRLTAVLSAIALARALDTARLPRAAGRVAPCRVRSLLPARTAMLGQRGCTSADVMAGLVLAYQVRPGLARKTT
jgi:hypothetical protein